MKVVSNFAQAFATSLVIAALAFIFFFDAPRLSIVLTLVWIGVVAFAFTKFTWRAFWFLLGTPLAGYGFFCPIPDRFRLRTERQELPMIVYGGVALIEGF